MQLVNRSDEIAEKMTREELAAFIHEYARTVDENKRGEFLNCLKKAANQEDAGNVAAALDRGGNACRR